MHSERFSCFPGSRDFDHRHTTDAAYLGERALFQFSLSGFLFSYSQLTNWFKFCALEVLSFTKVFLETTKSPRKRIKAQLDDLG